MKKTIVALVAGAVIGVSSYFAYNLDVKTAVEIAFDETKAAEYCEKLVKAQDLTEAE